MSSTYPHRRTAAEVRHIRSWIDPRPEPITALMVEKRLVDAAVEQADLLAELSVHQLEVKRWQRAAAQHRREAEIIQARLTLTGYR